MQSYEEAGGYGLPAYYDMSLAAAAATGYPTGSLMAAYGLPGSLAAASYGLAGLGGIPRRGAGVAGLAAARGGRGAMGRGGMRGRGAALAALGLGGFGGTGRGAGRGGGKMRGRGSPGGKRFNPMAPKPGNPAENDLGHIVFAYNIGENTTEEDVTALFSLYGTVAKVDVIWDYNKNITKGYAFITMPNYEEAEYAISQLNGYNYAGKPLQVKFKTEKKAKNGDGDAE